MTVAQEPRFIADPNGVNEDDGIIITTVYDFKRHKSSIFVIDAKTMTTLQEYKLPFRLSIQFHNSFYPIDQVKQAYED